MNRRAELTSSILALAKALGNDVFSRPVIVLLIPDDALEAVCAALLSLYLENDLHTEL